ncbi:MAG: hypothetical protein C3F02_04775 [Parcubacteria group bacterium]|nr:MAG: hypothetical protein C3F02_04775 [Parcubacteria group bacterium]
MEIKRTLKVIYKDKQVFVLSLIGGLLILASWLLFLVRRIDYSSLSVLHTNIYVGIDVLGAWQWLFWLPALALLVSLLNLVFAVWLWTRQRLWSYYFFSAIVTLNFFMLYYLYNIL